MGITPPKNYKKPKLKKDDRVLLVEMPDGPEIFVGRVSSVDSVSGGKVKVKGSTKDFSETGEALHERAILIPERIKASWSRSPFLRNTENLSGIVLNIDMLRTLDAENEKLS